MKKRKGDDKTLIDFKNNPFKSLKGFSPSSPSAVKKTAPHRKKDELHEDESELFLRAVSGARKIDGKVVTNIEKIVKQGKTALSGDAAAIQDSELFLSAMQNIGTTLKDIRQQEQEILEPTRRSMSSRLRQLK